jgi:hypothetical protein
VGLVCPRRRWRQVFEARVDAVHPDTRSPKEGARQRSSQTGVAHSHPWRRREQADDDRWLSGKASPSLPRPFADIARRAGDVRRPRLGFGAGPPRGSRDCDAIRGIACMEASVQPETWACWTDPKKSLRRSPAGEGMGAEQERLCGGCAPERKSEETDRRGDGELPASLPSPVRRGAPR